MLTVSHQ